MEPTATPTQMRGLKRAICGATYTNSAASRETGVAKAMILGPRKKFTVKVRIHQSLNRKKQSWQEGGGQTSFLGFSKGFNTMKGASSSASDRVIRE